VGAIRRRKSPRRSGATRDATPVSPITVPLLDWYHRSRRDLPWRHDRDPYRVWVSEVMLQQTQVATVIPYYERFLARFPDVHALARAPLDDVLKLWEGLGYYARARNLHRAAADVVSKHDGRVPGDPAAFRALPGVGVYMTAAVQSIAFGAPLAVVDGNVKRVMARLFAIGDSVDRTAGARAVEEAAQALLAADDPGSYNQAVMELGAMVCRPVSPACAQCPVMNACAARAAGDPEAYPVRDARRKVPRARIAVGVVSDGARVLITRRAETGMLGGLWEFPGGKIRRGETPEAACEREIREEVGLRVQVRERIARVQHSYSHLNVEIEVFRCDYRGGDVVLEGPTDHRWVTFEETTAYAFPKANHKFMPAVRDALNAPRLRARPRRTRRG
jgi:A/G-specific adenine glycosylase